MIMIKYLVLFIHLFAALFLNNFLQTDVDMDIDVPETINAGSSFQVNVTINKGELSSFSRYMHELPLGLKAKPVNSANADFTFKDQKVRLIWLRLPASNTINFSYTIEVDQRLKGNFDLKGMFSYIENNERKSATEQSGVISIIPSPDLPPDQIVDIKEFEDAVIPDLLPKKEMVVTCYRQQPDLSNPADGIIINLIVNKGNKEKFAKIEELIPAGYSAEGIETEDAIFTFKNNIAKFLWMNLPAESYFSVAYKLVPQPGINVDDLNINGTFSYIEGDKTISVDIIQEDFELEDNTEEEIMNIITSLSTRQKTTFPEMTDVTRERTEQPETTPASSTTLQKVTEEPVIKTDSKTLTRKNNDKSNLLKPETGVYYRVQIAAGHKPVNINQYFRKFNLEKTVKKEMHEGWHKYSVGSFKIYKDARDYRNYIWRTTEIDDAFVSAYNNGRRITVQEALMIANQKWYK